jgi:hypothetical protein
MDEAPSQPFLGRTVRPSAEVAPLPVDVAHLKHLTSAWA